MSRPKCLVEERLSCPHDDRCFSGRRRRSRTPSSTIACTRSNSTTTLSYHSQATPAVWAVQAPSRTPRMLPAIELAKAAPSQLQQRQSATDKPVNSLKAAGSAPMMQKIASSTGNLHLYDDFLSKLKGSPSWPDDKEATILEPFTYISASPGKDMRSQLIDAFNIWLRVPLESLDIIKQVVAELHNASLLMDDVEDDSSLRRGMPVAHKIYGIPQTINTANYIYFKAYQRLGSLQPHAMGNLSLTDIVNEELLNLHRGQGMDLYWRDSLTCPTEEEYIDMVSNKTGGLFRIAIRLMAATSSQPDKESYVPLVNLIGIIFQIADDYLNLQSDAYKQNKGFCEDLTEGKFSFPIVHSIRADTSNQRLLNVLRQRPTNIELKTYAVTYMDSHTDSFGYTRQVLERLDEQARGEVERLGGNPGLTKFLDRMKAIRLTQPSEGPVLPSVEK